MLDMSLWLFWRVIFHWEILGKWLKFWHSGRTKTPARTDRLPPAVYYTEAATRQHFIVQSYIMESKQIGMVWLSDLSVVPMKKQGGEMAQRVLLTQSPHSCDLSLLLLWGRDAAAGTREVLQCINCSPYQAPLCWQHTWRHREAAQCLQLVQSSSAAAGYPQSLLHGTTRLWKLERDLAKTAWISGSFNELTQHQDVQGSSPEYLQWWVCQGPHWFFQSQVLGTRNVRKG